MKGLAFGLGALALLAVVGLAWWLLTHHQADAQHTADVKAAAAAVKTGEATGAAAVNAVQQEATAEAARNEQTRKANDAISHAAGAETPVQPAVADSFTRAVCMRHSHQRDPACIALQHPGS